jgi:subtilisin family serine protease
MTRAHTAARTFVAVLLALTGVAFVAGTPAQEQRENRGPIVPAKVRARAEREGRVRVLVELRQPGAFPRLDSKLRSTYRRVLYRYRTVPYVALDISPAGLAELETASADVVRVVEDQLHFPTLAQSVPLIQGDQAWAVGYDGTGTSIAIIDTGVDSSHPFLAGKVVAEACFSTTIPGLATSTCPNGTDQQLGAGSAVPCSHPDCLHGTHVAGIAAGDGASAGQTFSGVAKGADIVAVQAFSIVSDASSCATGSCLGAFTSDIIAALEHVYSLASARNIAAVNMSLGSATTFNAPCDTQPYKPVIDNLRAIGVATVIAAGNGSATSGLSAPGCISSAVSVGSTDKSNVVSSFSNVASFLSLFAPGGAITSSVPGGTFRAFNGTSMATPHVAGTWAVIRQAAPSAGVGLILDTLRQTGLPITDTRPGGTATIPRVRIFDALTSLVPVTHEPPVLTSTSPSRLRMGPSPATLTLIGSGFDASSVAYWNGAPKLTSVENSTRLSAQITPADLAAGSGEVHVVTPEPGGGTSVSLTIPVDPAATLTPSATIVPPGFPVTVTLANGYGGTRDWMALARVGSANTSYLVYTYVGAGVVNRTWSLNMPVTAGQYEFRLFLNDGYTLAASSVPVTVDASQNVPPSISSLSPASAVAGGPAFSLTVNGFGYAAGSVVRWNGSDRPTTFVSATRLQAAITASDIASIGESLVTVMTPPPGGGTSAPATFRATGPPVLSVNATSVAPGGTVTVTLTDGFGGQTDWLSFALTTVANYSYSSFVYVGNGTTTRTWTVTAPSTAGNYEFRYFRNGGYTRAATSPTVVVGGGSGGGSNPTPVLTSLSPSSVAAGSAAFNLTVTGSGFVSSSTVRWNGAARPTTFLSATQLRAAIPATDVASAGSASVTVFTPAPGGGTSSSQPFTIAQGSPPHLTVSATSVAPGAAVTVTLTNSPGGSADWLAFALVSAPNTSYIRFTYVGAGMTTKTWTVTAPTTPGSYEFRLFLNNGYTRAATSPTVVVVTEPVFTQTR